MTRTPLPGASATRNSAMRPSRMRLPSHIGPVAVKAPSPSRSTTIGRVNGVWPGSPDQAPSLGSMVAPSPASWACSAVAGSNIMATTVSGASAAASASNSQTVSALPPAPGLSWVSASTTGRSDVLASALATA